MTTEPNSELQFLQLQNISKVTKASCSLAFIRSVVAGALAGGGPFTVMAVLVVLSFNPSDDWLSRFTLALAPIVIAIPLVVAGMLLAGLPATWLLRARRAESVRAYLTIGAFGGVFFALIATALFSKSVDWEAFGIFGATGILAGLTTSFVWGRHRMRLIAV